MKEGDDDSATSALMSAIAAGDDRRALALLSAAPALARVASRAGATRVSPATHFLVEIGHYVYAGDTPLHIAAAGYRTAVATALLAAGAPARAKNRMGAEPLHYAADGSPGSSWWNPDAQAATIAQLIAAGADPNAIDRRGVTALHRAARTRCSAAVRALLAHGADVRRVNGNGSTALDVARRQTGRGGTGEAAARSEQAEIVRLLTERDTLH